MIQTFQNILWQSARRTAAMLCLLSLPAFAPFALPAEAGAAPPDPILFAIRVEQGDVRTVAGWLEAGLDPNIEGDRIGTGLMIAASRGDMPMMELFVKHGADVNRPNQFNEQALMHAAWMGRREAAAWLLERGAQINREGKEWSALHYATFAGHDELAKFLIQKKADVNAQSTNGSTVLMMAAREGRDKIAAMLIEAGAVRSTKNDHGEDALTWAMRHSHLTIAKMITSEREFEEAAAQPRGSWGDPVNPVPAPPEVEHILQQVRLARAEGKPRELSDDEYRAIMARVAKMQPTAVAARQPKRLSITASKSDPARERAEMQFSDSRARTALHDSAR